MLTHEQVSVPKIASHGVPAMYAGRLHMNDMTVSNLLFIAHARMAVCTDKLGADWASCTMQTGYNIMLLEQWQPVVFRHCLSTQCHGAWFKHHVSLGLPQWQQGLLPELQKQAAWVCCKSMVNA